MDDQVITADENRFHLPIKVSQDYNVHSDLL